LWAAENGDYAKTQVDWTPVFQVDFIIIIINIYHELGLDRPVSASSNSLFKGLLSRLRPFGLQFSIIFGILLLFILVTFRSQIGLDLLSFSSTGSTFISFKLSSFLLSKRMYLAIHLKTFIATDVNSFFIRFF
jgi:hypothetical protein